MSPPRPIRVALLLLVITLPRYGHATLLMQIPGIDGAYSNPALPHYDGWSELTSWQVSVTISDEVQPRGSGPPEVVWGGASLLTDDNGAFAPIAFSVLGGTVTPSLRVDKLDGEGLLTTRYDLDTFLFSDAVISHTSDGAPRIAASINFAPRTYAITQYLRDAHGHSGVAATGTWDFEAGSHSVASSEIFPGDYDLSGYVDESDHTVWTNEYGRSGFGIRADGNGDGLINAADYTVWRDHENSFRATAQSLTIPEPRTLCSLALALIVSPILNRRRRRPATGWLTPTVFCLALTAGTATCHATLIMEIDGIDGNFDLEPSYSNAIELDGWEFSVSRVFNGDNGTSTADITPFAFSMELDTSYVGLLNAQFNGDALSTVVVDQLDEMGNAYLRYTLSNARVIDLTLTDAPNETARLVGRLEFEAFQLVAINGLDVEPTEIMSFSGTRSTPEPHSATYLTATLWLTLMRRTRNRPANTRE